jgi:hypothetical protein
MTTSVVLYFKTISGTGQTEGKKIGQKFKFLSLTEPRDNILAFAQVV